MSITEKSFRTFAVIAAIVVLIGIADAGYLTYKHYTAMPVPCTVTGGCEKVLTSSYASFYGIPLSVMGLAAYLSAFVLALIATFGNRLTWYLFTTQVVAMTGFSLWLLYVQAYILEAFCQFCLLSAGVTFTLLIITIISYLRRPKYA